MHDYRFIAILEPAPTDPCNHEAICRLLADETDMIMEKTTIYDQANWGRGGIFYTL